jgi:hypothetical protein
MKSLKVINGESLKEKVFQVTVRLVSRKIFDLLLENFLIIGSDVLSRPKLTDLMFEAGDFLKFANVVK